MLKPLQAIGCHGSDGSLRCCDSFDWTNTSQMIMYQPTEEIEAQKKRALKGRQRRTRIDLSMGDAKMIYISGATTSVEDANHHDGKKIQRSFGEHSRVATVATSTEPLHQKVLTC